MPLNILIVDDEEFIRLPLIANLRNRKAPPEIRDIREAKSLAEARAVLETGFKPDLVLLDHDLPDGIGPAFIPVILQANTDAFVCLISGRMIDDKGEARMFVYKPDLVRVLSTILLLAENT